MGKGKSDQKLRYLLKQLIILYNSHPRIIRICAFVMIGICIYVYI